ncbi:ABC transporter ATP-binding protein [Urechidicola croceus]|uniref:ABC transporter domain-containing protein n=1 Tax=Urechidicola croceus TaxID=1850246 RepID=A0A1D8P4L4_9FLAO|nr:ABC transporter ATP-binding protein [Urechidicola croceus]AOW19496.1 hypothetical protein LPB138_01840 [Urechidicola croceus]
MENEILVRVEGVSKKFSKDLKTGLKYGVKDVFSNIFGKNNSKNELRSKEFWSLKDINFELRRGECLGLIGHNGAGKSTLLKILNGLINPDEGKVTIKGRVGALIELGAGFNPILTGRENIYNNGAVLGFTKAEIDAKVEEIIDFAEIREFIDMPVQNYSSGMKVRLGFAVASQMEPDILLIDEVLAVGDVGFRVKCLNRISELINQCAVIFVSHSMPQVARVSTDVILLALGRIEYLGNNIGNGIKLYQDAFQLEEKSIIGNGIKINKLKFNGVENNSKNYIDWGSKINISFEFENISNNKNFYINLSFVDSNLNGILILTIKPKNIQLNEIKKGKISIDTINRLVPGKYTLNIGFIERLSEEGYKYGENIVIYRNYLTINVINGDLVGSIPVKLHCNWDIEKIS